MTTDIYRFPVVYVVKVHFLLDNLWISGVSNITFVPNVLVLQIKQENYWSFCRVSN